jgi:hypothetical protein
VREVNMIWNYCDDLRRNVWERERRFLSGFDFWPFLKGVTKEGLALPVQTVQEVAEQYAAKRRTAWKTRLAWRKSGGARRSLGWLPFKVRTIGYAHGAGLLRRAVAVAVGQLWPGRLRVARRLLQRGRARTLVLERLRERA